MEHRINKTIICTVLFLDIVEYSKKSVSGQIALKERFNAFLSTAIRNVPVTDRIILDTGDGAAISFLGDVEAALQAALSLRESLLGEVGQTDLPLMMRMGINLGPVRLVRDINGQPNIVGDGINVAQRIMGFADVDQILVSRSYFDAVSRLSHEYGSMFHYQGSRTDKHVREHEIYAIGYPGDFTATQSRVMARTTSKQGGMFARIKGYWEAAAKWLDDGVRGFAQASNPQRALFVGVLAVPALLLVVAVVKVVHRPATLAMQAMEPAAVSGVAAVAKAVPGAAATPPQLEPAKPGSKTSGQASAGHKKSGKKISIARTRTLEETTGGPPAILGIAVTPWGDVYLDGRMQGVSPPLAELQVAPGKHKIEIRNTTFPPFSKSLTVKAGEKIKIKHVFSN